MNNLWLTFLTGLTTGGFSCLAVQGGLLATLMVNAQEKGKEVSKTKQVGIFLAAKLIAYTLLGFGLGALGSFFSISPTLQAWLQIFAGFFMLATAARLLDIHPAFRYLVIQPPQWIYRTVKNTARVDSSFAPIFLGTLTILMPCGITQATMLLAIASGSAFWGAAIMFAFILGTSPVFFTLGIAAAELFKRKAFLYLASLLVAILGIYSINSGQNLRGSVHTIQNYWKAATSDSKPETLGLSSIKNGVQEVTIDVTDRGYRASVSTLKKDVPVRLTLKTVNTRGCSRAFRIPSLNISRLLPETGSEIVEFTPKYTGALVYTCSMGMYSGQFSVIN